MNTCSKHGSEIAFSGMTCPACEHIEEVKKEVKEEYEQELGNLEDENTELRTAIEDLKNRAARA